MWQPKTPLLFLGSILMLGVAFPRLSGAQEIKYTPSLSVSGEYNDNILFERRDELEDFVFNIIPAIRFDYATDLLKIDSFASLNVRRYTSETSFDREDQYYNLNGRYRLTERLRFRARFYYLKDVTQESRVIDFEETATDIEEGGEPGIERFLSERERYSGLASLNYRLTELSNLGLNYSYLDTSYDFEGNTDFEVNNFGFTFSRRMEGQRDRIGANLSYSQNSSETSDADTYSLSLIWHHYFTEIINLYSRIGVRYTEQEFNLRDETKTNWNGIADIRLQRFGQNSEINFGFRQTQRNASDGRIVNVSRFYGDSRFNLTERLFFNLEGEFYITKEDDDSALDEEDSLYFDIIPSLRYMLTENHSVRLAYGYSVDHDRSLDDDRDKQRSRIWLVFDLFFPKHL